MKTLKEIYSVEKENNKIDSKFYAQYHVKQGLRNANGTGVKVGLTKICDVVGYDIVDDKKVDCEGRLIFRGYSIESLINRQLAYEDIAFLLLMGRLPDTEEKSQFQYALLHSMKCEGLDCVMPSKHLLNSLQIELLKLYSLDADPDSSCLEDRFEKGIHILSSVPLFVFSHFYNRKIAEYPLPDCDFATNILVLARNDLHYSLQEVRVLNSLLMLHADHGGGNNSTFANVVISSTGTDIYSCLSAAIGSLKGPRHGGAASKVTEQFKALQNEIGITKDASLIQSIIDRMLNKDFFDHSGLVYGIGHAIYTKSDPRAVLIKQECALLAKEKHMEDVFNMLCLFEQLAVQTMKEKKGVSCCANVDFYSGFAYQMLGIDPSLYTSFFAISRMVGWISHHLENFQSNPKLIRPANVYIGGLKDDK